MKKLLSISLLVLILLPACGAPQTCVCECDCPPPTPEAASVTPEAVSPTQKVWTYEDMVVGFVQTGSDIGWRAANTNSFRETASKLGITLKVYWASGDIMKQRDGFRQFITDEEVNVIVLSALEAGGWEELLGEARDAEKIVIVNDIPITAAEDLYATYVSSDFVEEGRKAAVEMCRLLEDAPGKKVWELAGNVNSFITVDRGHGFREKMGECGIEITRTRRVYRSTDAKDAMENWLRESRDVQGIYAQHDWMIQGAIEALKEAGLKPGMDVKLVSVNATLEAFSAMLAGELNASVECNPLMAPQVYEAALRALNGEPLPRWIPIIEGVFRSDMPDLREIAENRRY